MTTPDLWTETLLVGIAEMLHDAGAGIWSDGTAAVNTGGKAAIVLVEMPQEPERLICLTDYPIDDDPQTTEGIVGLQVRVRGDRNPLTARRIADGVYAVLHGRRGLAFGTDGAVVVAHIYRNAATPIGPDSGGRHERSESYYVHVNRASAGQQ